MVGSQPYKQKKLTTQAVFGLGDQIFPFECFYKGMAVYYNMKIIDSGITHDIRKRLLRQHNGAIPGSGVKSVYAEVYILLVSVCFTLISSHLNLP